MFKTISIFSKEEKNTSKKNVWKIMFVITRRTDGIFKESCFHIYLQEHRWFSKTTNKKISFTKLPRWTFLYDKWYIDNTL